MVRVVSARRMRVGTALGGVQLLGGEERGRGGPALATVDKTSDAP